MKHCSISDAFGKQQASLFDEVVDTQTGTTKRPKITFTKTLNVLQEEQQFMAVS